MKYKKFEEIQVWKEARIFYKNIHSLILESKGLKNDYVIVDQLKRATCSIMLNIAEGYERKSVKEFAHFLSIAKGSAGEIRSILYILLDLEYVNNEKFFQLKKEIEGISVQLFYFRRYIINGQ